MEGKQIIKTWNSLVSVDCQKICVIYAACSFIKPFLLFLSLLGLLAFLFDANNAVAVGIVALTVCDTTP